MDRLLSSSARGWLKIPFYLASLAALVFFLRDFLQLDPLAFYKKKLDNRSNRILIELKDAHFKTYENDFMLACADVKEISVTRDRSELILNNIRNGGIYSHRGMVGFAARKGTWYRGARKLVAEQGAHLKNESMDLDVSNFEYSESQDLLLVPGSMKGVLFEGEVVAENLAYKPKAKSFEIGPVTWQGNPDVVENKLEDQPENTIKKPQLLPSPKIDVVNQIPKPKANANKDSERKRWTIKAKSGSRPPGDMEIWNQAEATDGEIVLFADRIERNVKTDIVVATGNIRYYGEEVNMTCQKATLYRNEKRALLEGNVNAYIKPKENSKLEVVELEPLRPIVPDEIVKTRPPAPAKGSEDKKYDDELKSIESKRKYPITVIAQRIEYWYQKGERRANISGSPQARQEFPGERWRQVWSHTAFYDGEAENLKLMSRPGKKDVRTRTSLGDDLIATWFQTSTNENEESWEGEGIEGDVIVDQNEDEE